MSHTLTKRACVSDCVVPSCSSISCSNGETCILSSQTCDACPSVSCITLNLTTTDESNNDLPKGAVAGIAIAAIVLLACLSFLIYKLYKRRQVIREISEKSIPHYSVQETIHQEEFGGPSGHGARFPSGASIQIGLGSAMTASLAPTSRTPSPLPMPDDHFFSADDLLRMSYAESIDTVTSTKDSDKGPAIMQANNPIVAVRAKAAVMQYTKGQGSESVLDEKTSMARQPSPIRIRSGILQTQQVSQSFWEEESVTASPIERELISPDRFAFTPGGSEAKSDRSQRQRESQTTPTKSRGSESRLSRADCATASTDMSDLDNRKVANKLFSTSPSEDKPAAGYDWFDPSLVNEPH